MAEGLTAGKVALVTGAGSGLGRAIAILLAREGASVGVADIRLAAAQETVALITGAGGQAIAIAADVADRSAVHAMVAQVVAAFGGLDLAVNNAGIPVALANLRDAEDQDWDRSVGVNLTGARNCLREELRVIRKGGSIVNVASGAGLKGLQKLSAYVASKHGMLGLTKSAALEHAAEGIRINAVCPGTIDTPWYAVRTASEIGTNRLGSHCPMGRAGRPEEIAEAVLWLLSDRASYVTGIAMPVDGGFMAM